MGIQEGLYNLLFSDKGTCCKWFNWFNLTTDKVAQRVLSTDGCVKGHMPFLFEMYKVLPPVFQLYPTHWERGGRDSDFQSILVTVGILPTQSR